MLKNKKEHLSENRNKCSFVLLFLWFAFFAFAFFAFAFFAFAFFAFAFSLVTFFFAKKKVTYGLRPMPPSRVMVSPDINLKSGEAS